MKRLLFLLFTLLVVEISAQPAITNFSPQSGPLGTTVAITGTGFDTTPTNNVVFFGAVKATVIAASSTSLSVIVPTGATYQYITVTDTNNLTAYSSQPFVVSFPCGGVINSTSFSPKIDFALTGSSYFALTSDFDEDGKPDLAVSTYSSAKVSIFRNTCVIGTISFAPRMDLVTSGTSCQGIYTGDIDGDGKPDLVVANKNSASMSVFRNTSSVGTISFDPKIDFTSGSDPIGIFIGDLNGDGKPEVAVTNDFSNTISVFGNTSSPGSISFAPKIDYTITPGANSRSVVFADVDGDSKHDIVSVTETANVFFVYRNTSTTGGAISFATKVIFATGNRPFSVSVGDLNEDGKPDIVVSNNFSNTLSVFRNTSTSGTISMAARIDLTASGSPRTVAMADLDGNGLPDLACANYNGSTSLVAAYRNTSSGGAISFATRVNYTAGTAPYGLVLSDLDGDSRPEMVSSNVSNISVFRNLINTGPSVTSPAAATICSGNSIGINLSATAASTYTWVASDNPNVTGESTTLQATGTLNDTLINTTSTSQIVTYTVTPTAVSGSCVGPPQIVSVTVYPSSAIMTSAAAATICSGTLVSIALTANMPSTYTWIASNNLNTSGESLTTQITSTLSNIITNPGTVDEIVSYTVTPTSSAGCGIGIPQTVNVTVKPKPTMTSVNTASICNGGNVLIPLTSTVAGTYTWIANNNPNTTGESTTTQSTSTINNTITNISSTTQILTYTVTPAANGCVGSTQTVVVSVYLMPGAPGPMSGSTSICAGSSNTYSIVAVSGATSYTWALPSGWTGSSTTNSITTTADWNGGMISVTPVNVCGSSSSQTLTVGVTSPPASLGSISGNSSTCAGATNMYSITPVFDATSYTWTLPSGWSGTSTTDMITAVSSTASGSVSVIANNFCGSSSPQVLSVVTDTLVVNIAQTNVSCFGFCDGTVTLSASGGLGPYTYSGPTTGLCAGTYTVTATDLNGCTGSASVTIAGPSAIIVSSSQTNVTCNGFCNGSITPLASGGTGPYTFSGPVTGLCSGTYTVVATDANGCTGSTVVVITEPSPLVVSGSHTNVTCNGFCNGSITPIISGGTAPYSTSGPAMGLCAGTYTVTATDANGCTGSTTVTITEPPSIVASGSHTNVTCNGYCDGTVNVVASGGSSGYTYLWTPSGSTTASIISLCAGTYACTIADSNGCTATAPITITEPPIVIPSSSGNTSICPGICVSLSASPTGGNGSPFSITWLPSSLTGSPAAVCPSTTSTYTCTAIDPMGCSGSEIVTVNVFAITPVTYFQTPSVVCISSSPILLTAGTPVGGTYSGSGVVGSAFDPGAAGAGAHNITYSYTDGNGCNDTAVSAIFVDLCTAIQQVTKNEDLIIYPNPFHSIITLSTTEPLGAIAILNSQGKLVYSENVAKKVTEIDFSELPSGIYLIRIEMEKRYLTRTVIKY